MRREKILTASEAASASRASRVACALGGSGGCGVWRGAQRKPGMSQGGEGPPQRRMAHSRVASAPARAYLQQLGGELAIVRPAAAAATAAARRSSGGAADGGAGRAAGEQAMCTAHRPAQRTRRHWGGASLGLGLGGPAVRPRRRPFRRTAADARPRRMLRVLHLRRADGRGRPAEVQPSKQDAARHTGTASRRGRDPSARAIARLAGSLRLSRLCAALRRASVGGCGGRVLPRLRGARPGRPVSARRSGRGARRCSVARGGGGWRGWRRRRERRRRAARRGRRRCALASSSRAAELSAAARHPFGSRGGRRWPLQRQAVHVERREGGGGARRGQRGLRESRRRLWRSFWRRLWRRLGYGRRDGRRAWHLRRAWYLHGRRRRTADGGKPRAVAEGCAMRRGWERGRVHRYAS